MKHRHHSESGTAVIVILFFLAILLIYIAGNLRTLHNLGRELKLLDQKQIRRLESFPRINSTVSVTNASFEPDQTAARSKPK